MPNPTSTEKIAVYRKLVDNGFPGPVMRYFYLTESGGQLWAAEVEDSVAESGARFEWDEEPCGRSLRPDEVDDYLTGAQQIGYIDTGRQLHITEAWRVPAGYGVLPDHSTVITSTEWVGNTE